VGTHHHLAVGSLAQRPTILTSDSNRGFAFLGKGGVVQHEDGAAFGTLLAQGPHTSAIEFLRVPIGIAEQVLEALGGGSGHRRGDGIAVFAIEVGQEPCDVALQGVAALGATKQRGEGLKEASYLR
jgi:hypothetical protein